MKKILFLVFVLGFLNVKSQCDTTLSISVTPTQSGGTATWAAVTGAVTYSWAVIPASGSTVSIISGATTSTIVSFSGLNASTSYRFQVVTVCSGSTSQPKRSPFSTTTARVVYTPMTAAGYQFKYLKVDSLLHVSAGDTTIARGDTRPGAIVYKNSDSLFYGWNGFKWNNLGSSTTSLINQINNKVDTIFYNTDTIFYRKNSVTYGIVLNLVPNIRAIVAGYGLAGGGDLSSDRSFIVDSTVIAPKDWSLAQFPQLSLQYNNPSWVATLLDSKLRSFSATNGQFLRYNGTTYAPTSLGTSAYADSLKYMNLFADQTATGTKTFSTIVVNKTGISLPNNYTVDEDAALQIVAGATSGAGRFSIARVGSNASFVGSRYGGNTTTQTAVLNTNTLVTYDGQGYNGTNLVNGGYMAIRANENWTGTNAGSYIQFLTNPNGTSTNTSSFLIYPETFAMPQTNFWGRKIFFNTTDGKATVSDNYERSVADYGANGSDLADDYPAFQAAINAGVKKIIVPEGTYYLSQALNLSDGISIEGTSTERCILKSTNSSVNNALIFSEGSRTLLPNLSANLAENATTVSLVSNTTLKRGDIIMLVDTLNGSFNSARTSYTNGFFAVVRDSITNLSSFQINGYALAALPSATTQLWKINPTNTSVSNLTIETKETHYSSAIRITYGNLNKINNVKVYGADVSQILIENTFNASVSNSMAGKHAADVAQLSYGIVVISSQDVTVNNVTASSTRHAAIIAAAGKFPPSRNVIVSNSTINAIGDQYAADLHGGTSNCTYKNNFINGGILVGGANHTITGNTITNLLNFECLYVTEAKQISHAITGNTFNTNKANTTNRAWIGFNINDYTDVYGKLLVSNNNFQYTFVSGNTPTEGINVQRVSGSNAMDFDFIGNTFKMTGATLPAIMSTASITNFSLLANNFDTLPCNFTNTIKLAFLGNKGTTAPTTSTITTLIDEYNEWDTYTANRVAITNSNGRLGVTSNLSWDNTNAMLGIGTTSPTFKIQVEDNVNASAGLFFRNSSTGTSAITQINASTSSGIASLRAYSPLNSGWAGVGAFFTDENLTGGMVLYNTSAANTTFYTNNDRRMDITGSTGNLLLGTSTDVANVLFNASSTTKGTMPMPRMTNAQRTALTVDATRVGVHVYQTDGTEGVYVYKSTGWAFAY